jgi:uncharacterized membrane protein
MSDPTVPPSPSPEPAPGPGAPPPPVPPQSAAQSATAELAGTPPAASDTGLAPNVAAGLACFFSIIGGIVFLLIEKKDKFVRFYAMQSLILGGGSIAFSLALRILEWILHFVPFVGGLMGVLLGLLGMLVGLAFFVVWIVTIIQALSGKEWEIPYIGKIARQQLAKMPTAP